MQKLRSSYNFLSLCYNFSDWSVNFWLRRSISMSKPAVASHDAFLRLEEGERGGESDVGRNEGAPLSAG